MNEDRPTLASLSAEIKYINEEIGHLNDRINALSKREITIEVTKENSNTTESSDSSAQLPIKNFADIYDKLIDTARNNYRHMEFFTVKEIFDRFNKFVEYDENGRGIFDAQLSVSSIMNLIEICNYGNQYMSGASFVPLINPRARYYEDDSALPNGIWVVIKQ